MGEHCGICRGPCPPIRTQASHEDSAAALVINDRDVRGDLPGLTRPGKDLVPFKAGKSLAPR